MAQSTLTKIINEVNFTFFFFLKKRGKGIMEVFVLESGLYFTFYIKKK